VKGEEASMDRIIDERTLKRVKMMMRERRDHGRDPG
jgi:hypothetical protein